MRYGLLVQDAGSVLSREPTYFVIASPDDESWQVIATARDQVAGLCMVKALTAQSEVLALRAELEGQEPA